MLYFYYAFIDYFIVILTTKLPNCQTSRNQISGAQFSGAQLSGAQLSGAQLSMAQLSGAQFSGAQFSGAQLSGAQLSPTRILLSYHNSKIYITSYCSRMSRDISVA